MKTREKRCTVFKLPQSAINVGKLKIGCPKDQTQDRGSEKGSWSHQTGKLRKINRDGWNRHNKKKKKR